MNPWLCVSKQDESSEQPENTVHGIEEMHGFDIVKQRSQSRLTLFVTKGIGKVVAAFEPN